MPHARAESLKRVLEMHRTIWDDEKTRSSVREAFAKVIDKG